VTGLSTGASSTLRAPAVASQRQTQEVGAVPRALVGDTTPSTTSPWTRSKAVAASRCRAWASRRSFANSGRSRSGSSHGSPAIAGKQKKPPATTRPPSNWFRQLFQPVRAAGVLGSERYGPQAALTRNSSTNQLSSMVWPPRRRVKGASRRRGRDPLRSSLGWSGTALGRLLCDSLHTKLLPQHKSHFARYSEKETQ